MKYKMISNCTYCLRLDKNEEILSSIKQMCVKEKIKSGYFNGIGAVAQVTIGVYNQSQHKYDISKLKHQYEITSLIGNITTKDKDVHLHAHINLSDKTLKVIGGHLISGIISITGEIIINKTKPTLKREFDKNIGINLIKF
jgi:predicted DNA-binding protein with PD1-like motif